MYPAHLFYLSNISFVFVVQLMDCTESCLLHFVYMCLNIKSFYSSICDACKAKSYLIDVLVCTSYLNIHNQNEVYR